MISKGVLMRSASDPDRKAAMTPATIRNVVRTPSARCENREPIQSLERSSGYERPQRVEHLSRDELGSLALGRARTPTSDMPQKKRHLSWFDSRTLPNRPAISLTRSPRLPSAARRRSADSPILRSSIMTQKVSIFRIGAIGRTLLDLFEPIFLPKAPQIHLVGRQVQLVRRLTDLDERSERYRQ